MHAPNISIPAALIGEPTRAALLMALCDGRAHPAGELADSLGISAQSASNHLALLLDGGLVSAVKQGRHRYFRLSSADVAQTIESLASISPAPRRVHMLPLVHRELCLARTCYSHLAGWLGVALLEAMKARRLLEPLGETRACRCIFGLTPAGIAWAHALGIEASTPADDDRLAISCVDWTERKDHLAGDLGIRILRALVDREFLVPGEKRRSLRVTRLGADFLQSSLGLVVADSPYASEASH